MVTLDVDECPMSELSILGLCSARHVRVRHDQRKQVIVLCRVIDFGLGFGFRGGDVVAQVDFLGWEGDFHGDCRVEVRNDYKPGES